VFDFLRAGLLVWLRVRPKEIRSRTIVRGSLCPGVIATHWFVLSHCYLFLVVLLISSLCHSSLLVNPSRINGSLRY